MLSRLPVVGRLFAPDPTLVDRLRALVEARRAASLDGEQAYDLWCDEVAERLGVGPDEVGFLLSAIGSWKLRSTVLRGTSTSYDRAHRAVFRALDALAAEGVEL